MIKVTLPDGNILEVKKGLSLIEIAKQISPSLAKSVLAAKVNDEITPIFKEQQNDFELKLMTDEEDKDA
jgi:threonyl-tRNA synthetase